MEDVDKEISEMKLSLNARARIVAESYLTAVSLTTSTLTQSFAGSLRHFASPSSVHKSVLDLVTGKSFGTTPLGDVVMKLTCDIYYPSFWQAVHC